MPEYLGPDELGAALGESAGSGGSVSGAAALLVVVLGRAPGLSSSSQAVKSAIRDDAPRKPNAVRRVQVVKLLLMLIGELAF